MKTYFHNLYKDAEKINIENVITSLSSTGPHQSLLDIGCWDGENSLIWAKAAQAKKVYGLEVVKSAAKLAEKKNIKTYSVLVDHDKWPLESKSINCIVSNQVVEHLSNLDHFFSQSSKILTPGGFLISSTNNLASWHNILATLLGWAPFDFSNSSSKALGIGNPLAIHRGAFDKRGASWTHKCIYTAKWFSEWGSLYGFKTVKVLGAGYYPLPAILGRLDTTHAAFMTVVMQLSS
jgi:SAM-dependent methyltransferase